MSILPSGRRVEDADRDATIVDELVRLGAQPHFASGAHGRRCGCHHCRPCPFCGRGEVEHEIADRDGLRFALCDAAPLGSFSLIAVPPAETG